MANGYDHVFVVDATVGGVPRQVTSGDFDHGSFDWSADGKTLYATAQNIGQQSLFAIDAAGEFSRDVVDELKALGAFGMKIPKEYGGLGFSQAEYGKIMELIGSHDGNLCALVSAHQSIGVPQPIKLFGT